MTSTALVPLQAEINAAEGNPVERQRLYEIQQGIERTAPASRPTVAVPAVVDAATTERALAQIESKWGVTARRKFERDNPETAQSVAIVRAVQTAYPNAARVAAEEDLEADPGFLRVLVAFGREAAVRGGDWNSGFAAPSASKGKGATGMSTDSKSIIADREAMTGFIERAEAAKRRGDSALANAIEAEKLDYIAKRDGNREIVNGRRTA